MSGVEVKNENVYSELIFYINRINDYIFLRPFGITTNVAGTFPYFIFSQTNALFVGSDWDIRYNHSDHLTSEAKVSYVYALETENNQPFIEIPPFNINYALEYQKGAWALEFNLNYMAEQWHAPPVIQPSAFQNGGADISPDEIFDFMSPTEDFLFLGARASYDFGKFSINIRIDNLLNTSYRSYTDRLRYFADAPGRNFSFSINVDF